jgi:hypothetical protein
MQQSTETRTTSYGGALAALGLALVTEFVGRLLWRSVASPASVLLPSIALRMINPAREFFVALLLVALSAVLYAAVLRLAIGARLNLSGVSLSFISGATLASPGLATVIAAGLVRVGRPAMQQVPSQLLSPTSFPSLSYLYYAEQIGLALGVLLTVSFVWFWFSRMMASGTQTGVAALLSAIVSCPLFLLSIFI